jgi:glycosyltransferase involved in cell wall biosynthesis
VKLIVQIPCLNEEKTLPLVLKDIPKKIKGIDSIEVLVIDDGCTDRTVAVAKKHGVKHIVRHTKKQGLARAFHDGTLRCLDLGADIVVNTDGDNQYPGKYIKNLVRPIINGEADMVIADRQTHKIQEFSPLKKWLQRFGTKILNLAAGTNVPDAPSGFRAYSREALLRLNVVTRFSYTMETLIQAGNKGLAISNIPITVNPKTRESRLFKSNFEHVWKSGSAIFRAYTMYRPYMVFVSLGLLLLALGLFPMVRYAYFFITDHTSGARHLQSLIAGSVLLIGSFISFTLGIVGDLIRINRSLIEDAIEASKRDRYPKKR